MRKKYNIIAARWRYAGAVVLKCSIYLFGFPLFWIYLAAQYLLYIPIKVLMGLWWLFGGSCPNLYRLDIFWITEKVMEWVENIKFHSIDDLPSCWMCKYCHTQYDENECVRGYVCLHPSLEHDIPEGNEKRIMCFKNKTDGNE